MKNPRIRVTKNIIVEIIGQQITIHSLTTEEKLSVEANEFDAYNKVSAFLEKHEPSQAEEISFWIENNVVYTARCWHVNL